MESLVAQRIKSGRYFVALQYGPYDYVKEGF